MHFSRQRKKILETLKNNVVHPSADYIHRILKEENSEIGLATVYRNLNKLAENGTIKKLQGLKMLFIMIIIPNYIITFFARSAEKFLTCPLILPQIL